MSTLIQNIFGEKSQDDIKKLIETDSRFISEDQVSPLVNYFLDRSYLEDIEETRQLTEGRRYLRNVKKNRVAFIRIDRLPLHPDNLESYNLLAKWQTVLSAIHTWGYKMVFVLNRREGRTSLYLGLAHQGGKEEMKRAISKMESALVNCMPGIEITPLKPGLSDDDQSEHLDLISSVNNFPIGGAITGIPSFRSGTQSHILQTLDQIAFGIRDADNCERDYCFVVIADPISDTRITDIIQNYYQLGNSIHLQTRLNVSESSSSSMQTSNPRVSIGLGWILSGLAAMGGVPIPPELITAMMMGGSFSTKQISSGETTGFQSSKEYINKFAKQIENEIDIHCQRLRNGRNLGFWNVGVSVLAESLEDSRTLLGILRSIYSGDNTHIEPIRIHSYNKLDLESTKNFSLTPLEEPGITSISKQWHILGKEYQYLSTPLNTQELSIITSLPRKDVPGLRFVKTAAHFSNNPGAADNKTENIGIGKIVDSGIKQTADYIIDINALVRHSLIVGSTGCGKTTTCKTIINSVLSKNIPVLIIEPAKDEYVRWAVRHNEEILLNHSLSEDEKRERLINTYMPGVKDLSPFGSGVVSMRTRKLKLNPFQPAGTDGTLLDMLTRSEQFISLLNSALPMGDILPVIIDEAIYTYLKERYGSEYTSGEMIAKDDYPLLSEILPTAKKILLERGYSDEIARGLLAALETRINMLRRGKRGEILNVYNSTPYKRLFSQPTVINLSRLAAMSDKSLIMSILLLSLLEYRQSEYLHNTVFRKKAQENRLLHLTVVEEAHNVLKNPVPDYGGNGNAQQVVADIFGNMLSEIRSLGEGLMIVDQIPTRLIPDAIRNTNYKLVHRLTSADDCITMAAALGLRSDQASILPLLSQGHAIATSDRDDAASWVHINKPKILM